MASPTLTPSTSAQNTIQPTTTGVSALSVKTSGGLDVMSFKTELGRTRPNLRMISDQDRSGGFYVASPNGSAYASLSMPGSNANSRWPHLQMDMGIGRPASEYVYENYIAAWHDGTEYFACGFEWFDATKAHLFRWNQQLDAPTGRYFEVVDRNTNRIIFNPGPAAFTGTSVYTALVEMRSEGAAVPVLRLSAAPSQTADILAVHDAAGSRRAAITPDPWIFLADSTAPTVPPTGGGYLYVEAGALRFMGSAGTVTTIAPA